MNRTTTLLLLALLMNLVGFARERAGYVEWQNVFVDFFYSDKCAAPAVLPFFSFLDNAPGAFQEQAERPDLAQIKEVESIKALRGKHSGQRYKLTGEVVITFQQNYHNRKYIQDDSGAILIDDKDGVMEEHYQRYDGITGLQGKLKTTKNVLEFQPIADPGKATSTRNIVEPVFLTIEEFNRNPEKYQSQLIALQQVRFKAADGDAVFKVGQHYILTDGGFNTLMTTSFYNADYIGHRIPQVLQKNLTGIAGSVDGSGQLFIRDKSALQTEEMVSGKLKNDAVKIYPNPAVDYFKIDINGRAQVEIFSVIGKRVLHQKIQNSTSIAVDHLKSGVYMVKVEQEGTIVTKKLIIQ